MNYSFPENFSSETKNKLAKKFRKNIRLLFADEINISYGKSILSLSSVDCLRLIFEQNVTSSSDKIFKNLLMKNFSDAERVCPGSGFVATVSFLEALCNEYDAESSMNELRSWSKTSRRGNRKELIDFLDSINRDQSLKSIYDKIILDAGFSSSCSVDSTYELKDYVKLEKSTKFKVRVDPNFAAATKSNSFNSSNANIIVADGIIENISEVHHILEHFHNNKKWCFLVCRGYDNNVISTLATNFLRGSLKIVPATLVVDIESINSLKDICISTGAELISTLKGDSISSIDLENLPRVNQIILDEQFLQIDNPSKIQDVALHASQLRDTASKEVVKDKVDLLEKRISSLTPRRLKIYFSNHDKDSVGLKKDQAKIMISLINSYCKSGKISLEKEISDKLLANIVKEIKKLGVSQFPAMTILEGIKAGISNAELLKNSRKVILIDSSF